MIILISIIAFLTILIIYQLLNNKYKYWKKKNISYADPFSVFGNYYDYITLKTSIGEVVQKLCYKFPDVPYFGVYYGTEPTLVVKDLELINTIFTKDFYYFSGREITKYTEREVSTQNLFFAGGDKWKITRQNMTPLFSSGKMKNMFYLIQKCTYGLEKMLDAEFEKSDILEVRPMMIRYTMGCIASCVFGVDTHTMESSHERNEFYITGNQIFENTHYRGFKNIGRAIWPAIFYGLGFKAFPMKIDKFFSELLTNVFRSRDYKPSSRKDFVDLVITLKENKYIVGDSLSNFKNGGATKLKLAVTDELLISQCVTLFAGGFETSATTLSFTLFELAKNQEAQREAFEEVEAFLKNHDGRVTYDCVSELPYLDACLSEALRLYPVLGVYTREVVDNYTLPTGLRLDKGVRVHIPVYYLHHNPDYFPEPEKYIPERFLAENKGNIKPHTYIAFGEGPRVCIGKRFGKMQVLAGLATLLKKYKVKLAPDMPKTLKLDPRAVVNQPRDVIRLKFEVRDGWENRVFNKEQ